MNTSYAVGPEAESSRSAPRRLALTAWGHRRDRRWWGIAATASLLVASAFGFAHVAEDYLTGDPIVRWDVDLARWLHEHSSGALVSFFEAVTLAGNAVVLAAVTAAAMLVLLRRRAVNDAAFLAVVVLGVELLNGALKLVFHRPRPELAFVHLDTYSFPSGHAAASTAIYGALAYLVAAHVGGRRRVAVIAAALLLVVLVGFSRLYLGAHYLSDVLAGYCVGAAWLSACLLVKQLRGDRSIEPLLPAPVRRALCRIAR